LRLPVHFRVATKDARLGLPKVKLGLLPGRRRHAAPAARGSVPTCGQMIVGGDPIAAPRP